ncbi:MAG: ABC transporter ATP-binding protein [Prevotella sp.]|nr:ABC transporter ATP-binding protein [Prevotella sp.]
MKYAKWLWLITRGIRLNSAVRIVVGIGQVQLSLLMVWLSKRFIDETIRTGTDEELVGMVLLLLAVVTCGVLLRQLNYYLTIVASTRQTNWLRLQAFNRLFSRQLYDDRELHSGDVTSRLTKDIDTVSGATTSILPQMIVTTVQLAGAFLLMRWFDKTLAWALLLLTPAALGFGKLIAHRLREMTLSIRRDESRIQMYVQEGMEHNAVLRSLGSERWVTGRLDTMQQHLKGSVMYRTRFTVVTRLLLGLAFSMGYMLAFVWGGIGLRNGTITFGVMTSFLQLVGMIQSPILSLLNMVPSLIHATASIDRLEELDLTVPSDSSLNGENVTPSPAEGSRKGASPVGVRFHDVTFRYATGDREVLEHFSHDFLPGTKTVLMGPTGIGKTTLFRLMLAFIAPTEGKVTVLDGTEETPVSEQTRVNFVFVPQGNTLMSGTIRYNLLLACPQATDDDLRQVLHTACADFVYDLAEGLDTELGERGSGLSEGQAQRIAIARGLLRPGTVLLLDEISSSLDEKTEHELYSRLFAACPDRTMLFITHRPAVAEMCDHTVRIG